jgi:hypothetical protein
VGLFQEQGIRLIAVGDNVDTAQGVDDFVPLRTLFAKWFARDTSRKIRAINNARTGDGIMSRAQSLTAIPRPR